MLAVHVNIQVKPDCVERFIEATKENAKNSLKEAGIARFDLIQQQDDPTRFMLVEVYRDAEAPVRHKETAHYARWRDTVESMMAVPRSSAKYTTVFPVNESGWSCSAAMSVVPKTRKLITVLKTFIFCVVLAVLNIGVAYFHMKYFADIIAQFTGYFVDLFIVPAVFGLITGGLAAGLLERNLLSGLKIYWWILLIGAVSAMLPSIYYVVFMTFFTDGSC